MPKVFSKNVSSAENQQERLIMIGWIVGFVDGEGCFSVGIIKQTKSNGETIYRIFHEFVVTQGAKSLKALEYLKDFFGVGQIVVNRRKDNHKEDLYKYVIRKRDDLLKIIIPFFKEYPLQTAKISDFNNFIEIMNLVESEEHLTNQGLIKILKIIENMNHKKSKKNLIRILRDYTPNAYSISDDIVRTSWRHEELNRNI